MPGKGLEPSRCKAPDPKSGVSANSTTRAKTQKDILFFVMQYVYLTRTRTLKPITLMQNASLAIITDDQKRILLVKRRDAPVWVLPGGGIEPKESPEHAALREAFEETGLTCEVIDHIATYLPINRMTSTTHLFTCRPLAGTLVRFSSETADACFFSLDALPAMLFPIHGTFIAEWQKADMIPIVRTMNEASYFSLLALAIRHPLCSLRYIWTRCISNS